VCVYVCVCVCVYLCVDGGVSDFVQRLAAGFCEHGIEASTST
jgi:hypothetical protein